MKTLRGIHVKNSMKKLFTIYDFAVGLIAALGYGFGFEIPKLMGCSIWLSSIICLVVGMLVEDMVKKIVFSRAVQKKSTCRFMALATIATLFLATWYLAAEFIVTRKKTPTSML